MRLSAPQEERMVSFWGIQATWNTSSVWLRGGTRGRPRLGQKEVGKENERRKQPKRELHLGVAFFVLQRPGLFALD